MRSIVPWVSCLVTAAFDTVFSEDAWAVAHMQRLLDEDKHDHQELVIGGDKAGLLFRRRVLAWVEAEYGLTATR